MTGDHYVICLVCPYRRYRLSLRRAQRVAMHHEKFHPQHAVQVSFRRSMEVKTNA
jgi:hypothetical protein